MNRFFMPSANCREFLCALFIQAKHQAVDNFPFKQKVPGLSYNDGNSGGYGSVFKSIS